MIDISKKLSNDKPVIKIAEGKEYKINNSKNTMLLINQEMQNNKNDQSYEEVEKNFNTPS